MDLPSFIRSHDIERVLCSFSGGKDSLVATHLAHALLKGANVPIEVVFVDTSVGLPVVRRYVEGVAKLYEWKLVVLAPERGFFELARMWGMPTPKRRWCCRLLKVVPLLKYASSLGARRVLFITGLRRGESGRRSKMKGLYKRRYRGVDIYYCDPIIDWSDEDVKKYIEENNLPINPVYKIIDFSGECFCGAFTKLEHLIRVAREYPEFIEKFRALEEAWRNEKFKGKNYKPFYAGGLKLGTDELLELAHNSVKNLNLRSEE